MVSKKLDLVIAYMDVKRTRELEVIDRLLDIVDNNPSKTYKAALNESHRIIKGYLDIINRLKRHRGTGVFGSLEMLYFTINRDPDNYMIPTAEYPTEHGHTCHVKPLPDYVEAINQATIDIYDIVRKVNEYDIKYQNERHVTEATYKRNVKAWRNDIEGLERLIQLLSTENSDLEQMIENY